jgi:hypothetical protein
MTVRCVFQSFVAVPTLGAQCPWTSSLVLLACTRQNSRTVTQTYELRWHRLGWRQGLPSVMLRRRFNSGGQPGLLILCHCHHVRAARSCLHAMHYQPKVASACGAHTYRVRKHPHGLERCSKFHPLIAVPRIGKDRGRQRLAAGCGARCQLKTDHRPRADPAPARNGRWPCMRCK